MGELIIGTKNNGIYWVGQNLIKHYSTSNGFPSDKIRCIHKSKDNKIWVSTRDAGVILFDDDSCTQYDTTTGICSNAILTICDFQEGIGMGSWEDGITLLKENKFLNINSKDGLSNNQVYILSPIDDKSLWVSTESGLNFLQIEEELKSIISFNKLDGLRGIDFYTGSQFMSSSGELYLGNGLGVMKFNPENIHSLKLNKPNITKIQIQDENFILGFLE